MAESAEEKTRALLDVVRDVGVYPEDAYDFLQDGLQFTAERAHKERPDGESRHVTGQELSLGLRDYAWQRWGYLARTVLSRWNITSTMDFGKIVYAMIDAGMFSKTDGDRVEDFRNVYEFRSLETHYVIGAQPQEATCPRK
jgi:uncharacterized repeat protein (TIGR04138 family)